MKTVLVQASLDARPSGVAPAAQLPPGTGYMQVADVLKQLPAVIEAVVVARSDLQPEKDGQAKLLKIVKRRLGLEAGIAGKLVGGVEEVGGQRVVSRENQLVLMGCPLAKDKMNRDRLVSNNPAIAYRFKDGKKDAVLASIIIVQLEDGQKWKAVATTDARALVSRDGEAEWGQGLVDDSHAADFEELLIDQVEEAGGDLASDDEGALAGASSFEDFLAGARGRQQEYAAADAAGGWQEHKVMLPKEAENAAIRKLFQMPPPDASATLDQDQLPACYEGMLEIGGADLGDVCSDAMEQDAVEEVEEDVEWMSAAEVAGLGGGAKPTVWVIDKNTDINNFLRVQALSGLDPLRMPIGDSKPQITLVDYNAVKFLFGLGGGAVGHFVEAGGQLLGRVVDPAQTASPEQLAASPAAGGPEPLAVQRSTAGAEPSGGSRGRAEIEAELAAAQAVVAALQAELEVFKERKVAAGE